MIAAKDAKIDHVTIGPGFDLAKLAGDGRVATGDVRAVPVGLYAKAALERLGAWAAVEPRMVMAEDVRLALSMVARGEAPLGIVYETDAKIGTGCESYRRLSRQYPRSDHLSRGVNSKCQIGCGAIFIILAYADSEVDL